MNNINLLAIPLDPPTLMVMNIVGSLFMGLSLLVVSRGYLKQIKGINTWAAASLIQSLGWVIVGALRGKIPDLISIVLGNGLVLLSLSMFHSIIKDFSGLKPNKRLNLILIIVATVLLLYYSLYDVNFVIRVGIISALASYFMLSSSYTLFIQKNKPSSHMLTAVIFVICGIILFIRATYSFTLDNPSNTSLFSPRPMQDVAYLTFFIISVMLTFGFILMCNDRYIKQREEAEAELSEAKKLAEELAGAKDRFLSNMSHEIRTPLNGIIGFTKILLKEGLPEKQKKQVELIKISSDILLVLINDILDLATINEGKMSLEKLEFNLHDLLKDVLATFKLRFEEKKLNISTNFDINLPDSVMGDSVRLSQILINIINNSKKFTDQGGNIDITVKLREENNQILLIDFSITDNGIGISKEKLAHLFQPFSKDNTHQKYEGTGLGLSIVKHLVDLMNGHITIESVLHKGTKVIISIPFDKVEPTAAKNNLKADNPLSNAINYVGNLRILLAEDNPINQLLAQTILNQYGFKIDIADNGKKAIELITNNQYDIILMDLKMPEMDGIETTQYIRQHLSRPKSQIPIVAITADVTQNDIENYKRIGMNDYVLKPFDPNDLLNKITELVQNKRNLTVSEETPHNKIA